MIRRFFRRQIALPTDHGSWVFLLSPLLIGLFAGGQWQPAHIPLILGALAGFLLRQPVTIAVKIYSGRRPPDSLPVAWFWIVVYSLTALIATVWLVLQGFAIILILVIPSIPIFIWYLYLVTVRDERRQSGLEIVATGAFALSAPAVYWISVGSLDPRGWWLFVLIWLQSAASIVHAYMRLSQRSWTRVPPLRERFIMGSRALFYTTFNLAVVPVICFVGKLAPLLFVPYAVQWVETFAGVVGPAMRVSPVLIGVRQLVVSTIFTLLFIVFWHLRF